jgi:eukaryotic-like serine/threonine-protein kinase
MESPDSTLVPGYRLDRYELLCPIASGGMASVWLARLRGKRGFEKLFAIKTIKTELIADPHFQEMFLDEARIASRIIHPNVAQILELGEQDDILYIVMEYVDGDSLAKINRLANKRGTPLPPGISMRVVAETCAGLHAAHQLKDSAGESLGVVHRDVSPQNVLITTAGTAKVIDFGLVKARNRGAAETGQGVVKGKIRYMAPEQVGGSKSIDHRADVWACGMCLYELITGHTPYHKEDDLDVVKRLMSHDPLPPFDVALPPQIEKILTKAIVATPDGRYDSCSQMRKAIEAAIHELDLPAESEDVSEFVRQTLPELASKRSKTIAKAMESADTRSSAVSLEALPPDAFAATEVSARDKSAPDDAVPLTRRLGTTGGSKDSDGAIHAASSPASDSNQQVVSSYNARTPSGTTRLSEQLDQRKRRGGIGYVFAVVVGLAVAGWILYPRAMKSIKGNTTAATTPTTSAAPSASTAASTPPANSTIELDPTAAINADAGMSVTPVSRLPSAGSAASSHASGLPKLPGSRSAGAGAMPPTSDGGLSPGAQSAAAIMLVKPPPTPTEPPPPPPPAP